MALSARSWRWKPVHITRQDNLHVLAKTHTVKPNRLSWLEGKNLIVEHDKLYFPPIKNKPLMSIDTSLLYWCINHLEAKKINKTWRFKILNQKLDGSHLAFRSIYQFSSNQMLSTVTMLVVIVISKWRFLAVMETMVDELFGFTQTSCFNRIRTISLGL